MRVQVLPCAPPNREWESLVIRLPWKQEIAGSKPASLTTKRESRIWQSGGVGRDRQAHREKIGTPARVIPGQPFKYREGSLQCTEPARKGLVGKRISNLTVARSNVRVGLSSRVRIPSPPPFSRS